jgi:phosphopantetheinyl transferase
MPLIRHNQLVPEGEMGIWNISESESWFLDQLLLYPHELRQLSIIKGRRRVEWLAARQLVHQMSGRLTRGAFIKDEHGKPHLDKSSWEISISHSHGLAAAIASPVRCGIDIQFTVPKITRLAHKFLRPEERDSIVAEHELDQIHFFWGAKEALYKAYGRKKLEFIDHIHITPFEYLGPQGQTSGKVVKDGEIIPFQIHYERSPDGYMLVWGIEGAPASR